MRFSQRNAEIYLYATELTNNNIEASDLYIYRLAEKKALQIAQVSRVLKENAVDCLLNQGIINLSEKKIKQKAKIHLSTGKTVIYKIGDKPFTNICDYMDHCSYKCNSSPVNEINKDTYNEKFIIMNTEKIIRKIRNLYKEHYIYSKTNLIMAINRIKKYPLIQINIALNQLINDKNEYITDMLGRTGFLVNIGEYYMFQPIELDNKHITRFSRSHPIDYKREQINITLPEKIIKLKGDNIDINQIIREIEEKYKMALTDQIIERNNWYTTCNFAIQRLKEYIPIDLLERYILEHIIDTLYLNKRELINYIYFKDNLTKLEKLIKKYLGFIYY